MKGIYLTQEGKQDLEDYLEGLKTYLNPETSLYNDGKIDMLKEILTSATILPVDNNYVSSKYPNGLIIQPKK